MAIPSERDDRTNVVEVVLSKEFPSFEESQAWAEQVRLLVSGVAPDRIEKHYWF